ncbi:MAG: segregation/condensation protein A [Syntrophomonadaceae bacterium]|nr:segregation/condensation protein A [Syntrophomonadaceae bacterium]
MSYLVNLEKFYGPLDLLLYLLEKEEIDIYDIPIAAIADQYIEYIHDSGAIDLDNIGDFLIMASYLLNLKSRMLLPGVMAAEEEDGGEAVDPREELVNRLLEYKKYKQAADFLAERYNDDINRVFFRNGLSATETVDIEVSGSLNSLVRAFSLLLEKMTENNQYELPQHQVDIGEKMDFILRVLPGDGATVAFQDFYAGAAHLREVLACFLALLELIRLQKVEAYQEHRFGDIKLCLRVEADNVDAG